VPFPAVPGWEASAVVVSVRWFIWVSFVAC